MQPDCLPYPTWNRIGIEIVTTWNRIGIELESNLSTWNRNWNRIGIELESKLLPGNKLESNWNRIGIEFSTWNQTGIELESNWNRICYLESKLESNWNRNWNRICYLESKLESKVIGILRKIKMSLNRSWRFMKSKFSWIRLLNGVVVFATVPFGNPGGLMGFRRTLLSILPQK